MGWPPQKPSGASLLNLAMILLLILGLTQLFGNGSHLSQLWEIPLFLTFLAAGAFRHPQPQGRSYRLVLGKADLISSHFAREPKRPTQCTHSTVGGPKYRNPSLADPQPDTELGLEVRFSFPPLI
jgi:hypothetical protein